MTAMIFFIFSTLNEAIDCFAQLDALHFLVAQSQNMKFLSPQNDYFIAICSILKLDAGGFLLLAEAKKRNTVHDTEIEKMKQFWKGDHTSPFPAFEKQPVWRRRTKLENGFDIQNQCITACANVLKEELPLDWYEQRVARAIKILDSI